MFDRRGGLFSPLFSGTIVFAMGKINLDFCFRKHEDRWSGLLGQETGIHKWEVALD